MFVVRIYVFCMQICLFTTSLFLLSCMVGLFEFLLYSALMPKNFTPKPKKENAATEESHKKKSRTSVDGVLVNMTQNCE